MKLYYFFQIHIHDNTSILEKFYPETSLPSNYGGSYTNMENLTKRWVDVIIDNAEWLDQHHKNIELELPAKEKSFEEDLGINGCFRKLEID